MQRYACVIMLSAAGVLAAGGCDTAAPPHRVPVPTSANPDQMRPADYIKPLPPQDNRVDLRVSQSLPPSTEAPQTNEAPLPPPPAPSAPTASSTPPTQHSFADVQRDFADAYKQVGQPRIVIFVNHSLQGRLVPASSPEPWLASEHEQPVNDAAGNYLKPGEYADALEHSVDYAAIENRLGGWLEDNGQVTIIPAAMIRQKLSNDQMKELESGQTQVLAGVGKILEADIFIQVQPHPMHVTQSGLELRLAVQALNTRDAAQIAHALVDLNAPVDQAQIEGATKSAARELMVDMIRTWTTPMPGQSGPPSAPPPASAGPQP